AGQRLSLVPQLAARQSARPIDQLDTVGMSRHAVLRKVRNGPVGPMSLGNRATRTRLIPSHMPATDVTPIDHTRPHLPDRPRRGLVFGPGSGTAPRGMLGNGSPSTRRGWTTI